MALCSDIVHGCIFVLEHHTMKEDIYVDGYYVRINAYEIHDSYDDSGI